MYTKKKVKDLKVGDNPRNKNTILSKIQVKWKDGTNWFVFNAQYHDAWSSPANKVVRIFKKTSILD